MNAPLLEADGACIEEAGAELVEGLSASAPGERLALLGDWEPLFRLLTRRAVLSRGTLRIGGIDAATGVAENQVGVALSDPVLPPDLKVRAYLAASARLTGLGLLSARSEARRTLEQLGIKSLGKRRISTLNLTERRALMIAHAALGDARVLVLELPFGGLDRAAAESIAMLVERVAPGRRLVASVEMNAVDGPAASFVASADRVVVLASGRIAAIGEPKAVLGPTPRCVVWTTRAARELAGALEQRGVRVDVDPVDGAGGGRLVVHLPDGADSALVVEAALEVSAPIVELLPLGVKAVAPAPSPAPAPHESPHESGAEGSP